MGRSWGGWIRLVVVVSAAVVGVLMMALAHRHIYLGFALFLAGLVNLYPAIRGLRSKLATIRAGESV